MSKWSEWLYLREKAQQSIIGDINETIENLKFTRELVESDKGDDLVKAEKHIAFLIKQLEKVRYGVQLVNEGEVKEAVKVLEGVQW